MQGQNGQKEAAMPASANDAQNMLVSLGFSPVDPVMPGQKKAKAALAHMKLVRASDEYRSLLAQKDAGSLNGTGFKEAVHALISKMEKDGAFD
jgi:hypothetical protein